MSDKERVRKVIFWLISEGLASSQKNIAEILGYNESSFSQIVKGDKPVSQKFITNLSSKFEKINKAWILTGEGSMLKEGSTTSETSTITDSKSDLSTEHIIKYFELEATAGVLEVLDDSKATYKNIVIPGFDDCDFALNVAGDSMYPELKSGQIAILKEWKESYIEYGNTYLVVTRNGHRMIKRLRAAESKDEVLCESVNPIYDPFEIKKADILKLYLVKGHIERSAI
jgi:Predicted transcriptional regulator